MHVGIDMIQGEIVKKKEAIKRHDDAIIKVAFYHN